MFDDGRLTTDDEHEQEAVEPMPYIISIDQSRCIGAGNCVHIAPKTFQLDEENIAYLVDRTGDDDEAILDAAKSCPTDAIYLDTEDGEAVYP